MAATTGTIKVSVFMAADSCGAVRRPLVFSLQYGRAELGDLVSKARPDDVPIKPNETYTFKLHPGQTPAWEQSVAEGRHH